VSEPRRPGEPSLAECIRDEIRSGGPIPFARFMERALYEPQLGYYAGGESVLGPSGDFFTASDAGRSFGRCLLRQMAEIDRRLGEGSPFHVLEFGAGRGLLARDVIDAATSDFPELRQRLEYTLIDRSPAMREAAAVRVPEAQALSPEELEPRALGCVVAVELFDALPVHRVRRRDGRLLELRVGLDADG